MAAETYSDLRTVARERAPWFYTAHAAEQAFALASVEGQFDVNSASPLSAAARITVPVLLIHGADDVETRPEHSRRVFEARGGPKRLILVPGAGHNRSLRSEIWSEIERWLFDVLGAKSSGLPMRSGLPG